MLSQIWRSNAFTKHAAFKKDARQLVPEKSYVMPDEATRQLLARLLLEETLETIKALGMRLKLAGDPLFIDDDELTVERDAGGPMTFESVIDGACDVQYVAGGIFLAVGAPDEPHTAAVCEANNRKFPNGVAITDPRTGKYLKPVGWSGPDHTTVMKLHHAFQPQYEQAKIVQTESLWIDEE